MDDATGHYISVLHEYRDADSTLDDYAATLRNIAQALSANRDNFSITNTAIALPIAPMNTVNGDVVPDAKQVQMALRAYHHAKRDVMNAWQQVPDDVKGGLQQPPFLSSTGRGTRHR